MQGALNWTKGKRKAAAEQEHTSMLSEGGVERDGTHVLAVHAQLPSHPLRPVDAPNTDVVLHQSGQSIVQQTVG